MRWHLVKIDKPNIEACFLRACIIKLITGLKERLQIRNIYRLLSNYYPWLNHIISMIKPRKSQKLPPRCIVHERYERFFRLLGANNNQAKALSVAQIYGLLDYPYDKNIKRAVSEYLKIDQESLMELLDIGVMNCSWIHGAIQQMRSTIADQQRSHYSPTTDVEEEITKDLNIV